MKLIKNFFTSPANYILTFAKWVGFSVVMGVLGGVLGSVFHLLIDYATHIRTDYPRIILFLPLAGVFIALLYSICKRFGKLDTNRIIKAVLEKESVPFVLIPLIFVSTVITHLFGGSAGREGAALQLGGGLGYRVGKLFRLGKHDTRIIIMTGMSSVFTALFGTPLTASVFSIEVSSVGIMHYTAFFPCLLSSIIASEIQKLFGLSPVKFNLEFARSINFETVAKAAVIAILCALVSIAFCLAVKYSEKYFKKFFANLYMRALVGGAIIVVLTAICGTYDYNGAGMDIVEKAFAGNVRWEAFILKIVFTAITIGAGFKGGEIVPAFFVGSTFGALAASIIGFDVPLGAAIGFVTLFCCVVNCPLASVMLAFEVFGGDSLIIFALCCAIGYVMSGNYGLYKSQKIVYSKLNERYADVNAK